MASKIFLSLFLVGWFFLGKAQVDGNLSLETQGKNDTTHITSYTHLLALKLYGVNKSNTISLFDDQTGQTINYRPNDKYNIGFGFNYQWIGLDLAFNLLFINDDDEVFGETKRFDIQWNLYGRRTVIDVNYQSYTGYYIANPESYIPNWNANDPVYPLRPDMASANFGVSAFYIFNHKRFSYKAAFIYNERQKKSAGSFLLGPYFSFFTIQADSSIVPVELRDSFNPNIAFAGSNFSNLGVAIGYAHTFVIKQKFFISLTLALGLGAETITTNNEDNSLDRNKTEASARVAARFSMGYNSDKFFIGLSSVGDTFGTGNEDEPWLQYSVNNFRMFIGRRFSVGNWFGKKKVQPEKS